MHAESSHRENPPPTPHTPIAAARKVARALCSAHMASRLSSNPNLPSRGNQGARVVYCPGSHITENLLSTTRIPSTPDMGCEAAGEESSVTTNLSLAYSHICGRTNSDCSCWEVSPVKQYKQQSLFYGLIQRQPDNLGPGLRKKYISPCHCNQSNYSVFLLYTIVTLFKCKHLELNSITSFHMDKISGEKFIYLPIKLCCRIMPITSSTMLSMCGKIYSMKTQKATFLKITATIW